MSDCPYVPPWYAFAALRPPTQCELTARMKRELLADFFGTCPAITDAWKDSRLCRHDGTPAHPSTHGPNVRLWFDIPDNRTEVAP